MEEEFVFYNMYEENDIMYIVVCESEEQGMKYLMEEKGLENPKLKETEKIKRERRTIYPYYVMKYTPFHEFRCE